MMRCEGCDKALGLGASRPSQARKTDWADRAMPRVLLVVSICSAEPHCEVFL